MGSTWNVAVAVFPVPVHVYPVGTVHVLTVAAMITCVHGVSDKVH